ncbi:hypothetical protein BKA66DRAFT_435829 [Pyrenochaeta sp. MPI-SDFR-AT-0127]|nr:hypothetical protein BKA66DRAFT_435829 [Pyrenochaeta sp. MPI-SDFR-AT-0127]
MPYTSSSAPLECFCGRFYSNELDLKEHRLARGHFPSHHCQESCEHPPASPHAKQTYKCDCCDKLCERLDILQDHRIVNGPGHRFCPDCDLTFGNQDSLETHLKTLLHASEFKCCDCDISFQNASALNAHMEQPRHRRPAQQTLTPKKKAATPKVVKDIKCNQCQRAFSSSESLKQHQESVKHKPLSNLSCPLGKGCRGKFTTPSALIHHLESGKCKSGMNREEIYRMVQSCDTDGMIHSRPALTSSISSSSLIYTPSIGTQSSAISFDTESEWSLLTPTPSQGSVEDSLEQWSLLGDSQISLDGSLSIDAAFLPTLQCPLCPKKRKKFANALALQHHMDSPAHAPKLYHCPTNLFVSTSNKKEAQKRKERHFSTLSGLSQHLESGACRGGKRAFLQCIGLIQDRLEQLGFGGIRVLLPQT